MRLGFKSTLSISLEKLFGKLTIHFMISSLHRKRGMLELKKSSGEPDLNSLDKRFSMRLSPCFNNLAVVICSSAMCHW